MKRNSLALILGFLVVLNSLVFCDDGLDVKLLDAIYERDLNAVKVLMSQGANPNNDSLPGLKCGGQLYPARPSIHTAAALDGTYEILMYVAEHGGNLNLRSRAPEYPGCRLRGHTPAMEALNLKDVKSLSYLISKGADVNLLSIDEAYSALSLAVLGKQVEAVELLLGKSNGIALRLAFIDIIEAWDEEWISRYLERFLDQGSDINTIWKNFYNENTALIEIALRKGSSGLLAHLLARGANPNIDLGKGSLVLRLSLLKDEDALEKAKLLTQYGTKVPLVALQLSVENKQFLLASYLLTQGLDVNGTVEGKPLIYIPKQGSSNPWILTTDGAQMRFLIEHGLRINERYEGMPLLMRIARSTVNWDSSSFEALLKGGADANLAELNTGETTLIDLCNYARDYKVPGINLLLDNRADPNLLSLNDQSALFRLIQSYETDRNIPISLFERLIPLSRKVLNQRANGTLSIQRDITPLHMLVESFWSFQGEAEQEKAVKVASLLLENGADRSIKDGRGLTPLELAKTKTTSGIEKLIQVLTHNRSYLES